MNKRIEQVASCLHSWEIDGLWIENPIDLFYLTGQWFSKGELLICRNRTTLVVDGRYFEAAKNQASGYEVLLASKETGLAVLSKIKVVGFDSASITVDRYAALSRLHPNLKWEPLSRPLKQFRVCKDQAEIGLLKEAAVLTNLGLEHAASHMQEGIREKDLAWIFEKFCKEHGAEDLSFKPIVAFGKHSSYPHYRAGEARLEKNQMVLFDVGAVLKNYRGDMTRVLFFGKSDPLWEKRYRLVQEAYKQAFSLVRPGCRLGDLDKAARFVFEKEGVEHLFSHGLGHGIGLETHEYPAVRKDGGDQDLILEEGMVFTIEPGLYWPGDGGLRYENTIVVTKHGAETLLGGSC